MYIYRWIASTDTLLDISFRTVVENKISNKLSGQMFFENRCLPSNPIVCSFFNVTLSLCCVYVFVFCNVENFTRYWFSNNNGSDVMRGKEISRK